MNDLIHDYAPLNSIYYVFHWSTFLIIGALVGVPFLIFLYLPYSLLKSIFSPLKKALSSPPPEPTDDHATLAVLISGCDTGFGRDLAERLLTSVPPPTTKHKSRSYKIFALCLRDDSCSKINALNETADPKYGNEVVGVQVDVTSDSSVSAAVSGAVLPWLNESSDRILHAVVNNAGIGTPGFVDMLNVQPAFSSPHSYRNDMEVNFYGMIRLTQAALPILKAQSTRKSASRYRRAVIVNVTSMAGLVASPNMSAYTCSKHAAEAFSTCLKLELKDFNISVTTVNPSFHGTPLVANIGDSVSRLYNDLARSNPGLFDEYGSEYIDETRKISIRSSQACEWRAANVSKALEKVVYASSSGQVLVGSDAKYMIATLRHLPVFVQDALLNVAFFRWNRPKAMM
ncbi:hypothetical protein TeGR_g2324 [Tetraparma gracilis]|uniref:Uncharacterized protein n=1 Tax=Tetraparma gracilis TaxID=2962635 RepID=A0ABQ6ME51_9STRA|nr:hypothetical protein TeGR_g2324 [Tetraparma gracilis]